MERATLWAALGMIALAVLHDPPISAAADAVDPRPSGASDEGAIEMITGRFICSAQQSQSVRISGTNGIVIGEIECPGVVPNDCSVSVQDVVLALQRFNCTVGTLRSGVFREARFTCTGPRRRMVLAAATICRNAARP